jgi:hypothetical protein
VAIAYAKPVDCVDIIPALSEVKDNSSELEGYLHQSLSDASRLFESELLAPVDYFGPAGEDFEERLFRPSGTQFVKLAPYVEIQYINDEDGDLIDKDEYILNNPDIYYPTGYFLKWEVRSCKNMRWNWNSKIYVSARWGFPCIPPDVVVAVKNMGSLMFLTNSAARLGLNTENISSEQETRLRNTYNRIMQRWQDRFHHNQTGVA